MDLILTEKELERIVKQTWKDAFTLGMNLTNAGKETTSILMDDEATFQAEETVRTVVAGKKLKQLSDSIVDKF